MTRQEIEHQMLTLSLSDKVEMFQSLTKSLNMSGKGITKTPGVCGGKACIAGTRIAVWLLVEAQQLGISEAQLLQDYSHITAADLVNAWSYADAYPEEIAAAIRVNLDEDDMLPEYDFSKGVRGKHHQAYLQGHSVTIDHQDGTTTTQEFPPSSPTTLR